MRAHIVRSRGQVAVHSRTPAVAARMPPAVMLVINLRIGAAADCCCGNSSSLLLPDSVKPAVQRGVQNSRGLVPPEAERSDPVTGVGWFDGARRAPSNHPWPDGGA